MVFSEKVNIMRIGKIVPNFEEAVKVVVDFFHKCLTVEIMFKVNDKDRLAMQYLIKVNNKDIRTASKNTAIVLLFLTLNRCLLTECRIV